MELELKNIGKITSAKLKLDGITVIAGENNTGKSTIGKALYSAFNGMSNLSKRIYRDRIRSVENILSRYESGHFNYFRFRHEEKLNKIAEEIVRQYFETGEVSEYFLKDKTDELERLIEDFPTERDENFGFKELHQNMILILGVDSKAIQDRLLYAEFDAEFGEQISSVNNDEQSYVNLIIKEEIYNMAFYNNKIETSKLLMSLGQKSVYLDNPFVLDENFSSSFYSRNENHQVKLHKLLLEENRMEATESILLDEKLDQIFYIFENARVGNLISATKASSDSFSYQEGDVEYSLNNVSLGLKTFIILKTLIQQGHLVEKGMIVLDEPEIHLHPQWQIMFAELIVLLQKTLNLHILLTTHSPYFLEAIEIYSKLHKIDEKCNYYLNEKRKDGVTVREVNEQLDEVYEKFFSPFQRLEDLRAAI